MAFSYTTKPYAYNELPKQSAELVAPAQTLSESVKTWKKSKVFTFNDVGCKVDTFYTTIDNEYWMSRVSKHKLRSEQEYYDVIEYLNGSTPTTSGWELKDRYARSKCEIEYIHVLTKVDPIAIENEVTDNDEGWILVNLEYELGKPLNTREFNEYIYVLKPRCLDESQPHIETSFVVSLVADIPLRNAAHTHGVYTSIERLQFNKETLELEWMMSTSSDAGGNVPRWLQNATVAKSVANDVPFFFKWLRSR